MTKWTEKKSEKQTKTEGEIQNVAHRKVIPVTVLQIDRTLAIRAVVHAQSCTE